MVLDDIRKALESMIGLTPAKALEVAKPYLGPQAPRRTKSRSQPATCCACSSASGTRSESRLADEVDGRGDAGRSRWAPQAGARSRAGAGMTASGRKKAAPKEDGREGDVEAQGVGSTAGSSASYLTDAWVGAASISSSSVEAGRKPCRGARGGPGGHVTMQGAPATKSTTLVNATKRSPSPVWSVRSSPWWGELAAPSMRSAIDPSGRDCLDAGASTGGFTDCLLNAARGTSSPSTTGYGQLAWELRTDRV